MPINGVIWKGRLRLRVSASASGGGYGGTPSYDVSAQVATLYATSAYDVGAGFVVAFSSYDSGDGNGLQGAAVYDGPGAPYGGLRLGGGGGGEVTVALDDAVLYTRITGGLPQLDFTLRVYFDGALVLGPYAYSFVGVGVGPNYVPLLGYVAMGGSFAGSVQNVYVPYPPYDLSYGWNASGTCTLAYEAMEEGASSWLSFPVAIPSGAIGVSGTDTSSISLSGYSRYEAHDTATYLSDGTLEQRSNIKQEGQSASCVFVPGADRALSRMAPDYRCTVFRSGFPQTVSFAGTFDQTDFQHNDYVNNEFTSDPQVEQTNVRSEVHPSLTAFKGLVGQGGHPVLEQLAHECPMAVDGGTHLATTDYHSLASGNSLRLVDIVSGEHNRAFRFPDPSLYNGGVESFDTNPYVYDWQYHYDPLARYFGSWGSPFWKTFQWFPPADVDGDTGEQAPQSQWPLDGGAVSPQYWKLGRTQWSGEPSAPPSERIRKRTDLIGSAVEASGLTLLLDNYFAGGVARFLGWSRSPVMECRAGGRADLFEDCPDALTLRVDSAPSWSSTDADLSFSAAGVRATPKAANQTTVTVRLALNGWAASPYLYPQTCGSVDVGQAGAGGLDLVFVSALGGSATVANASGTVAFPLGADSGYAGSWGIEDGVPDPWHPPLTFTIDHGVDLAPGGESYFAMLGHAGAFGGLTGRQAGTLEFRLTLSKDGDGHALPATLAWPTFHRAAGTPTVVHESGQCAAILWPDGPMVRYGSEYYWDGEDWNEPPLTAGLGYSPTILDAIGFRRAYLQGVSPLHGGTTGTGAGIAVPPLTTELAARYTPFEGQGIAQVDQASWTFVLPSAEGGIRLLLGNTYQEVPPIAMFGAPRRTAPSYAGKGAPWGGVYDLCKGPRDVVSPAASPLRLYDPQGNVLSSPVSAPSSWHVERYDLAVGNDEPTTYELRAGGTAFARVRPWHGWIWLGKTILARWVASLWRGDGRPFRMNPKDGDTVLGGASITDLSSFAQNPLGKVGTDGFLVAGRGSPVIVGLVEDGALNLYDSPDEGRTLSQAMTDGPATAATGIANGDGTLWCLRVEGGTLRSTLRNVSDLSKVAGPFDTNLTGLSDSARIDASRAAVGGNKPAILLHVTDGGTVTSYLSLDAKTFTP